MKFTSSDLGNLWIPNPDSNGEDNGQVTIIGGSKLFHGAPMFAIKAASRLVDMVYFGSPEQDLKQVSKLNSFIWTPWEEIESYVMKSDAVLIGPGLMRFHDEMAERPQGEGAVYDESGTQTKMLTKFLLQKYPDKQWVIDGGSLQVMEKEWIPKNAILTPNKKEYELLFGHEEVSDMARKYSCIIVDKGAVSYVTDGEITYEIDGGNAGLTKGGTGDTLAGLTVGIVAKNPPILAAAAASFIIKKTAEELYEKVGYNFNADDLADSVFGVVHRILISL